MKERLRVYEDWFQAVRVPICLSPASPGIDSLQLSSKCTTIRLISSTIKPAVLLRKKVGQRLTLRLRHLELLDMISGDIVTVSEKSQRHEDRLIL